VLKVTKAQMKVVNDETLKKRVFHQRLNLFISQKSHSRVAEYSINLH